MARLDKIETSRECSVSKNREKKSLAAKFSHESCETFWVLKVGLAFHENVKNGFHVNPTPQADNDSLCLLWFSCDYSSPVVTLHTAHNNMNYVGIL
jgi:hypothetical protein